MHELDEEIRERLKRARRQFEALHGDITYEEVGRGVAKVLGYPAAVSKQRVSNWFNESAPSFAEGCALCLVLDADPMLMAVNQPLAPQLMPMLREKPKEERILATVDEPVREDRNRRSNRRRRHG